MSFHYKLSEVGGEEEKW